jgi:hypothetical protein
MSINEHRGRCAASRSRSSLYPFGRAQIGRTADVFESAASVAVTRRGETFGIYVPTPRKSVKSADMTELPAAADRLAAALSSGDEERLLRSSSNYAMQEKRRSGEAN